MPLDEEKNKKQNKDGPRTSENEDGTTSIHLEHNDIALVLRQVEDKTYWIYIFDRGKDDQAFIRQMIYGAAALAADDPELLFGAAFDTSLKALRKHMGSSLGDDDPATEDEQAILRGEKLTDEEIALLTKETKGNA